MVRSSWIVCALLCTTGFVRAQVTSRVSVSSTGEQGNGWNSANLPALSADGRYVGFASTSTNLVPDDTNGWSDIFLRDRLLGTTERVNVSTGGAQADAGSGWPAISDDGRHVAFRSLATNLVAYDTNAVYDVFVRDRLTGVLERVSIGSGGTQANSHSFDASISADGRFVAFATTASNLVGDDTNGTYDVFVRDRVLGTTERVSVSSGGQQVTGDSFAPVISADGIFVAFASQAAGLVAGDTNGWRDIFVRNRALGTTERVSVASTGAQASSYSDLPAISADGRYVAFESPANNLDPLDTGSIADVFVHDRTSGTTERVSLPDGGGNANLACKQPTISDDGRFVTFLSQDWQLVPESPTSALHVYMRDRVAARTHRISVRPDGSQSYGSCIYAGISGNGLCVEFDSWADDYVAGDTNGLTDVFVRDLLTPGVPFCFGDGTSTPCPCGNSGPSGHGCANSLGTAAILGSTGGSSLSRDTLRLVAEGMPDSSALYFQGTSQIAGGAGAAFGDGLRCVGGSTVRIGLETNVAGASAHPGPGDPSISVRGGVTAPGTREYQVWYRNAASFCHAATFNLTNALHTTWAP